MRVDFVCCWVFATIVPASADVKYSVFQDTDFVGNDMDGAAVVDSIEECAQLCLSTSGCSAASWNGPSSHYADGNCNLKCSSTSPSQATGEVAIVAQAGSYCGAPTPAAVPEDLRHAYEHGDLLFTDDEGGVKYRPEVGNGFVATVVGSNDVYVAGVFNGCLGSCKVNPSRRARIPAPLNLRLSGSVSGAALDIRGAAYLRRYSFDWGTAELRFYAHRARSSLLVVDVSATASSESVKLTLEGAGGLNPPWHLREDFDWTSSQRTVGGRNIIVWSGVAKEAETVASGRTQVAVVFPADAGGDITVPSGGRTTFVASVRTSLESSDPEGDAVADWEAAAALDAQVLFAEHTAAWAKLWESGFDVGGRLDVARAVNSSKYFLLSSMREDATHSLSPGGLASNGYNGHTFWDCETWMYPSMVLWHPELAKSLLQYRMDRVDEAKNKAKSYDKGYSGAMFPWESAASGAEECPSWADTGQLEQHITGDIAFAAQQLWYAQGDKDWLRLAYPDLLNETANFWVSRVDMGGGDGKAHIKGVIPPDEYATGDDSVYTNYVAQRNLLFTAEAARELGEEIDPHWASIADAIPILFDADQGIHPEFDGYNGQQIKQGDVILLGFPLMMDMPPEVRRADIEYYAPKTDGNGPAMTWAMHAVAYLELKDHQLASSNFERSFANAQQPFYVWTETPTGGAVNFITGVGGFLQAVLFGLPGLRIWPDHLAIEPSLVEGMTSARARGVHYQGAVFDLSYDSASMTLTVTAGETLTITEASGKVTQVGAGSSMTTELGSASITVSHSAMVCAMV